MSSATVRFPDTDRAESLTDVLQKKLANPEDSPVFDFHRAVDQVLADVGLTARDSGGKLTCGICNEKVTFRYQLQSTQPHLCSYNGAAMSCSFQGLDADASARQKRHNDNLYTAIELGNSFDPWESHDAVVVQIACGTPRDRSDNNDP